VELVTAAGVAFELGTDPAFVPSGDIVLAVGQGDLGMVRLDGRLRRLSQGNPGLLTVDLTRSTGYHRLEVAGETYWFATVDAKLRLDGLVEMLRDMAGQGTAWNGQILFSDGSVLRDPHVVYAWLDEHLEGVVVAARRVVSEPVRGTERQFRPERHMQRGMSASRTAAFIRRQPRERLELNDTGTLVVDGLAYSPIRVVTPRSRPTLDMPWNHRLVALLDLLSVLVREVADAQPSEEAALKCRGWTESLQEIARHPTTQAIRRFATPRGALSAAPHAPELSLERYGRILTTALDLAGSLGWAAVSSPVSRYSYVAYSDDIYQAWAATRVARAFGLAQCHPTLGAKQPAFSGDAFDLYYDTTEINHRLRSWRSVSDRPDHPRPDLVVVHRPDGKVALLDAKYRTGAGAATEDSRKEVASYMATYGLDKAGIVYPPGTLDELPHEINGVRMRMLELPLRPGGAVNDGQIRTHIESLMSWGMYQ